MNIGYVFDLNGLLNDSYTVIPFLKDLCVGYCTFDKAADLTVKEIIEFRDNMLTKYANKNINKHVFFFVLENDKQTLGNLSNCITGIQGNNLLDQQHCEIHVLCNFIKGDGFDIVDYEKSMPCLVDNRNCVYTWLLDKYDGDGSGRPIISKRRIHAIWRLIGMLCNHHGEIALQQMTPNMQPLYHLFGDSALFFDEVKRNKSVRNYYFFKNLQHLLNLPDAKIEEFMQGHVLPYLDNPNEIEKRIDATTEGFLSEQRVPIEASAITSVTQNLLIKSSDDDKEYLVDVKDDSLVYIDDLARKQEWQMKGTDALLQSYYTAVDQGEEQPETLSKRFLDELGEKAVVQKRIIENKINKEISKSRDAQINTFKKHSDTHLLRFLNKHDDKNYNELEENLLESEVRTRCSNIDYGIAFLDYLIDGKSDYLVDDEVAVGDICFDKIRRHTEELKIKRAEDLRKKEKEIYDENKPGIDGEPSRIKSTFNKIDKRINDLVEKIWKMNFQIEKWWDSDSQKKLTVKSRATIAFLGGLLLAFAWLVISLKWIMPLFSEPKNWRTPQWEIFALFVFAGTIASLAILWFFFRDRRKAYKELEKAKRDKKSFMHNCMEEQKQLVELRYKDKLAFYAMKTIVELIEVSRLKRKDLLSYRKALFKQMIRYKLALIEDNQNAIQNDFNTVELKDLPTARILFGPDPDHARKVGYCFAQGGIELSESFDHFRGRKALFETTRFNFDYVPAKEFDKEAVAREVIPARDKDRDEGLEYTALPQQSVLPNVDGIEMDDVHQGQCGDCYFMATLASIAQMNPDFIIGEKGLVEELDEDHNFFRVRFYDKEGNRIDVDIDNKFWNRKGVPFYAGIGKSDDTEANTYDPWVMAVEKAWAKANNNGYDGIEGASADGKERVRKVEYSFAVTGKSAYYCMTKNVPNSSKLDEMIKKHFAAKKPITLYSADPDDKYFSHKDQFLVTNHAYALRSVNPDGTFDIFNPWNSRPDGERGQHYHGKTIGFIKDNFDVVVFFDIKESDFASFERDLTENIQQKELTDGMEELLSQKFEELGLENRDFSDLLTTDALNSAYAYSCYLYNITQLRDRRDVNGLEQHLFYVEGLMNNDGANRKVVDHVRRQGEATVQSLFIRNDDNQGVTLLRISPQYVLSNFVELDKNDSKGNKQEEVL